MTAHDDRPEDFPDDELHRRLQNASRDAGLVSHLPSGARIRARGNQRRTRATVLRSVAAVLVVGGIAGTWSALDHRGDTNPPPATASPTLEPQPSESADPSVDVLLQTPDGRVLATLAEPGVQVQDPAAVQGEEMDDWFLEVVAEPDRFVLRNGATTDERDQCLQVPVEGSVSTGTCAPGDVSQEFSLTRVAEGGAVTLRSDLGYVVVEADGSLSTSTNAADAGQFLTLDPADGGSVPDL